MPADTELAWAAGFLDGECCFHAREVKGKRHAYYIAVTLSVSQKHPELLYRLREALGAGVINGPYTYDGFTHYQFRITGYKRVMATARLVWPFLGIHKKRQAVGVQQKYKAGPTKGSTRRVRP